MTEPTAAAGVDPRDISYASAARTSAGKAVVRVIENLTGRIALLMRVYGFEKDVASGEPIWDVMVRRFRIDVDVAPADFERIPAVGPAVVLANHPFGVLDALAMGVTLHRRRPDFKILANAIFYAAPELRPYILPVDFSETRDAVRTNLRMRADAIAHLKSGGCVAVFPAGAVSTSLRPFGPAYDPDWKPFAARLMRESGAPAIPVLFEGSNTRLFHAAGHLHPTLRTALYMREFNRRVGGSVRLRVGEPRTLDDLRALGADAPAEAMARMRADAYLLSDGEQGSYGETGPPLGPRAE